MELLRITLDLPESVNTMYKAGRNGQRYLTERARNWQKHAVYSIRDLHTQKDNVAIQEARERKEPLALYLDVTIPAGRILDRDSDNMIKLVQDSVAMALWPSDPEYEDCYVFDVHVTKRPSVNGESAIFVALMTLEDEELRHAIRTPERKAAPPRRRRATHRTMAQPGTRNAQKRARAGNRTNAPDEDAHRAS